jgi:hypothetical protein
VERGSAEPQEYRVNTRQTREAGDSLWLNLNDDEMANNEKLPPASAGLMLTYAIYLGFRYAPPQDLFCRPHPRAKKASKCG